MPIHTCVLCILVFLATVGTAQADTRSDAEAQAKFGIAVAQKELWREALYRWERATQIDPSYAEAWNNLGVAYEHYGEFGKAREAYEKALDLAPTDVNIQQNYDLFREINDRIQESR